MKILAVADEESKYLWEYYEPSKLRDIDPVSYTHLTLPTT